MTEAYVRRRKELTAHREQCTQHINVCQYVVAWHPCAATGCQASSSNCCSTRDSKGSSGTGMTCAEPCRSQLMFKVCGALVTLHTHEIVCPRAQISGEAG